MDKPLFSILTASYNNAPYLSDWANSILQQKYRPLEVVFVNDCSKDNTADLIGPLVEKLRSKGIQVTVVSNENRLYYSSALKTAWMNAKGQFFGILDSDDCLEAGSVEYIMDLYTKYPDVGWMYTQFDQYDVKMQFRRNTGFSKAPKSGRSLLDMAEKGHHGYSHWRTFSNRVPRLHKVFKDGLRCAVDKYMAYRLEEVSVGMFAPRICYRYRHGVPRAISRIEKSIRTWKTIIDEAKNRRKKYNITPVPVAALDPVSGKRS